MLAVDEHVQRVTADDVNLIDDGVHAIVRVTDAARVALRSCPAR